MELEKHVEDLPVVGLGAFIFIAGASKFIIPGYWTGYEPQLLVQLAPLTSGQLVLAGGIFEAAIGAMLVAQRKIRLASSLLAIWLAAITLQLARLGLWDLAIRDLGLTFYTLSIYLLQEKRE